MRTTGHQQQQDYSMHTAYTQGLTTWWAISPAPPPLTEASSPQSSPYPPLTWPA